MYNFFKLKDCLYPDVGSSSSVLSIYFGEDPTLGVGEVKIGAWTSVTKVNYVGASV